MRTVHTFSESMDSVPRKALCLLLCCVVLSGLNAGLIKQHTKDEYVSGLHVARCMLLHIDKTPPDGRMEPTHETAITPDPACLGRRGRTYRLQQKSSRSSSLIH
jgi:hypothetical protein